MSPTFYPTTRLIPAVRMCSSGNWLGRRFGSPPGRTSGCGSATRHWGSCLPNGYPRTAGFVSAVTRARGAPTRGRSKWEPPALNTGCGRGNCCRSCTPPRRRSAWPTPNACHANSSPSAWLRPDSRHGRRAHPTPPCRWMSKRPLGRRRDGPVHRRPPTPRGSATTASHLPSWPAGPRLRQSGLLTQYHLNTAPMVFKTRARYAQRLVAFARRPSRARAAYGAVIGLHSWPSPT